MNLHLDGKVVVVVGASKGIGFQTAKYFLKEHAIVAICSHNSEALDTAVLSLSPHGVLFAQVVDATDLKQLEAFAQAVVDKFSRIDCWVNNVGGTGTTLSSPFTKKAINEVTELCLYTTIYGCQIACHHMKQNSNGGAIVNVSSLAARIPTSGRSTLYGPLKAAVIELAKTFAGEYAAWNIRVNAVLPGFTLTETVQKTIPASEVEIIKQRTLLGRMATPEEISAPIVFLCSDQARYITGTSLEVSGGRDITLNPEYSYKKKKSQEHIPAKTPQ